MKILVACEESQVVCKEFRKLGHEAYSCDIDDCSGGHPEWHIKDDILNHLDKDWDMIIAFPPCTYLCSSGLHWNGRVEGRQAKTAEALDFIRTILNNKCPKIVLENPIGCISTQIRPPDQKIQPWQFGHDASKNTCLWLKGVKPLEHTEIIAPKGYKPTTFKSRLPIRGFNYKKICGYLFATILKPMPKPIWGNQTPSGQNKLAPSPDRAKLRSKTYTGIGKAMAEQWGINNKSDL